MQRGSRGALHPQGFVAISAAPSSFMCTTPLISSLCKLCWGGCKVLCLCTPSCSVSPISAACPHAAPRAVPCLCTQLSQQQPPHGARPAGTGDGEVLELHEQHFQGNPAAAASSERVYSPATAPGSCSRAGASSAPGAAGRGATMPAPMGAGTEHPRRCQHGLGEQLTAGRTEPKPCPRLHAGQGACPC